EPRRPGEEQVVDRLVPLPGGLDDDAQVLGELTLADELAEAAGAKAGLLGLLGRSRSGVDRAGAGIDRERTAGGGGLLGLRRAARAQDLAPGPGAHRSRASSRRAERTRSSTELPSSSESSAPRISSGP